MAKNMSQIQDLDESLSRTRDIAQNLQQFARQQTDAERKLHNEVKAHKEVKDKVKVLETELTDLRVTFDQEKKEHGATKLSLGEKERFNVKAQDALKALADDLVSVRLQNESLRAEMELQRKAFVCNVNWAARHAEMKAKSDEVQQDLQRLHALLEQMKEEIGASSRTIEESTLTRQRFLKELEAAKQTLAGIQDQIGDQAQVPDNMGEKLAEVENLKVLVAKNAEQRKKNKDKARAAMEKSFLAGDSGLLRQCVSAWASVTKQQKLQKTKKAQSQAVASRAIATSGTAIMDFCITGWYKVLQERKKAELEGERREIEERQNPGQRGSNKKVLAQLEKQFGQQEKGLLREFFAAWQGLRADRIKREKAKAVAYRTISNGGQVVVSQCFAGWMSVSAEAKLKRSRKAASNAKATRMVANGDNAIIGFCLTQWAILSKKAAASKRAKEGGNTRAARMMAGHGSALQQQYVVEWAKLVHAGKDKAKKMKAVERNLVSLALQMVQMVFSTWKNRQESEHRKKQKKLMQLKSAEKAIVRSSVTLIHQIFGVWWHEKGKSKQCKMKDDLANAKGVIDVEGLEKSRAELEKIHKEYAAFERQTQDLAKRFTAAEETAAEKLKSLKTREEDYSKFQQEIRDTVRKARDINDELGKVGQFLATWGPLQRRESRSGSRNGIPNSKRNEVVPNLPKLDGSSNSRPRSGARIQPTAAASPAASAQP